jgi:sugar phosphate isomerase/epimerase
MIQFGVTQGRLVPSRSGHLQCFPQDNWAEEFAIAARLGLRYVELLAERQHNPGNPLWSADGLRAIDRAAKSAGLTLYSTINDYILDYDIVSSAEGLPQCFVWCDAAAALGLTMLVVPLMDASDPAGRDLDGFVAPLRALAERAAGQRMDVVLETIMPMDRLLDLVSRIDRPNVGVCFDTGNRIAQGFDIYAELPRAGALVHHVHIKDKAADGENVFLGTGQVNFHRIAQALAAIGYQRAFTFEAPRGRDPIATGAHHLATIRFFLTEAGVLPPQPSGASV